MFAFTVLLKPMQPNNNVARCMLTAGTDLHYVNAKLSTERKSKPELIIQDNGHKMHAPSIQLSCHTMLLALTLFPRWPRTPAIQQRFPKTWWPPF